MAGGRRSASAGLSWTPLPRRSTTARGKCASWPERRAAKIAPKIATPKEPPIERKKVAVEVATPMFSGCASFCTTRTSTCMTSPMPTPTISM